MRLDGQFANERFTDEFDFGFDEAIGRATFALRTRSKPVHRIDTESLRCSCGASMCRTCGGCSKECECHQNKAR
jgi:hypothetical protein